MKNISVFLLLLLFTGSVFISLLSSCTLSESGMKPSTGAVNELLIVTNDKTQWEGALGDTLRAFFSADQVGLSQPEPVFDLVNIADENLGDIFKNYHNIFIVDINPQAAATVSETKQNLWSDPQRIIKITAPDLPSFYAEFNLKKESFIKLFIDVERQRTLFINKLDLDYKLSNTVEKRFGIRLSLPEGFYLAKETADFMWLRYKLTKAKQDVELGIMIYSMDYNDTIVFNPRHIIQWRNALTMEYIPGPSPISFMKVAREYIPPVFDTITDFPGGYAVETRGLWEVENDFMGGPFINYTFIDKVTNKVITLDGYVYNPNDAKKNFLRQLEAVFFSVKFISTP
jgi:hypothetical protein